MRKFNEPCSVDGCNAPSRGLGFCALHYQRVKKHGSPFGGKFHRRETGTSRDCCKVDGCNRRLESTDYCHVHYRRWREYGDPLSGAEVRVRHGEKFKFIDVAANYQGDGCLIWPFKCRQKDGRGSFQVDGKEIQAHRAVCEAVHGPAPNDAPFATHSCGNGHLGCVNGRHLRWGSPSTNMQDMTEHGRSLRGRKHPKAKLTEEDVLFIRSNAGRMTQQMLADKFGVLQSSICAILKGKSWGWLQ